MPTISRRGHGATRGDAAGSRWALVLCALSLVVGDPAPVAAQTSPVRSLLEIRQDKVVVQKYDLSCGAAGLATLLRYQHGDFVSEQDIAKAMIGRKEYLEDPDLIRYQHGFSLLDLKRYVDGRGYEGIGYGGLEYEDLENLAPILVPLTVKGYNHFVVYRGALANRVLVADPAFGNRTMLKDEFTRAWIDYETLGHVGFVVGRRDGLTPRNNLVALPEDFVFLR